MPKNRKAFHNVAPDAEISSDAPRDVARQEFASRLQRAMTERGWNQSELARRATEHLEDGVIGRDSVSGYIRGKSLPSPSYLLALSKALNKDPEEILPSRGQSISSAKLPPLDVRDLGDNRVWMRVNQAVDWSDALKIMQILKGEDD